MFLCQPQSLVCPRPSCVTRADCLGVDVWVRNGGYLQETFEQIGGPWDNVPSRIWFWVLSNSGPDLVRRSTTKNFSHWVSCSASAPPIGN